MSHRGAVALLLLALVLPAWGNDDDKPGKHDDKCVADCRDGNPCTIDVCTPSGCAHMPALDGLACDDGDACTEQDTCYAGQCGGVPPTCDDGLACTADSCVAGACRHEPRDAACGGGECAVASCRPGDIGADARGCVLEPVADGARCTDDGVACTEDVCGTGACRHLPRDLACGSGECGAGSCRPGDPAADARGCLLQPGLDGAHCTDDRVACTNDVCAAGACQHVPRDAVCGGVDCGSASCRPGDPAADARGCVAQPVADGDRCTDDGVACTEDVCAHGVCRHVPRDEACGSAECGTASCRPTDPDRDARGCVVEAGNEGASCTDDGFACTDEVCSAGECRHEPRDERCGGARECRIMTCAPGADDADDHGCAPRVALDYADECAEDDDPCTDDVCRSGRCAHEDVPDVTGCAPLRGPFRRARDLHALARELGTQMASAAAAAASSADTASPLHTVETELEATGRALAGKLGGSAVVSAGSLHETLAQARARVASTILRRTPAHVATALRRLRAQIQPATARGMRDRGRELLRGTRALRSEVRRITRVTGTLVR